VIRASLILVEFDRAVVVGGGGGCGGEIEIGVGRQVVEMANQGRSLRRLDQDGRDQN
jgi:hypothetical protein